MSDPESKNQAAAPPHPVSVRDILLNTISSYGLNITNVIVTLILIPVILKTLGSEQFGLWVLVWAVVSLFTLMNMGFGTSVVKYVADARGRNDDQRQKQIVCTLFWVYVAQTIALLVIVGICYFFFNQLFDIPPGHRSMAQSVLLIVGCGYTLGIPLEMFRGVLIGQQKQRVANAYLVLGKLAYLGSVLALLSKWPDLRLLAVLNVLSFLVPYLAISVHTKLTTPSLSFHPRHFRRKLLKEVWSVSFYFMLIHVASLIAHRIDTVVIVFALDLTAVAIYAVAMRITEQAQAFCLQISRTLTPVVAELHGAGEETRLVALWLGSTKIAVAFAAPLLVGCAVLSRPLIVHWTGEEFAGATVVLQILLAFAMITVIYSNSANLLSMRGEQRRLSFGFLLSQLLNLALSILFVRFWGLVGVALATLLSILPYSVGVVHGHLKQRHGISHWEFFRKTVWPSLVPALLMMGGTLMWINLHPIGGLLEVALVECVAIAVFWILFWKYSMTSAERATVAQAIRRQFRRSGEVSVQSATQEEPGEDK